MTTVLADGAHFSRPQAGIAAAQMLVWPSCSDAASVVSAPEQQPLSLSNGSGQRSIPEASTIAPVCHASTAPPLGRSNGNRRRGCQHCVTCCGLQHHRHSTMNRCAQENGAEWWPGGIQSPSVYYHLRSRQLHHQIKHPQQGVPQWRMPDEVTTSASALLARRQQNALAILVPVACTNVPQGDAAAVCVGEKTICLPRSLVARSATASSGASTPPASAPPPAHASCIPIAYRSSKVAVEAMDLERASRHVVEPKRRCTEAPRMPGHFVAVAPRPTPFALADSDLPIFPGKVLQHTTPPQGSFESTPSVAGMLVGSACLTAPLSTGSETSSRSATDIGTEASIDIHYQQLPLRYGVSWDGNAFNVPPHVTGAKIVPMLQPVRGVPDPSLQHYYRRQASIKAEQAFPCHQVVDLSSLSQEALEASGQHQLGGGLAWGSVLRTLAGSLKRSMSP